MLLRVALTILAVLGAANGYAQVFNNPSVSSNIDENSDVVTTLNSDVTNRLNTNIPADTRYELDSRGDVRFTIAGTSTNLTLKTGQEFDREKVQSFQFAIVAKDANDVTLDSLVVNLTINDLPEKPEVLGDYANATDNEIGRALYIQRNPDIGVIQPIHVTQVLRDPERVQIQFKPCADDFQVVEYTDPDDQTTSSTPRGQILEDASSTGTVLSRSRHCFTAPAPGGTPEAHDVERGGQVVNVTTLGQTIQITPVAASTTGGAGVRRAELTFRGWAGTPDSCAPCTSPDDNIDLSPLAKITVYVKTGANNPPTFAGGAQGFRVNVNESVDKDTVVHIGPPSNSATAWNASDLDGDNIIYRLQGSPASVACRTMADGNVIEDAVALGNGCAWIVVTDAGNVEIKGKNLDFESAPPNSTYTISLVASDGYNPAQDTSVPILVVVQNVDEGLVFSGEINQISQLVVGRRGRSVDLNDHFTDPDGTPITYSVVSNNPSIVSVSLQGSILSVKCRWPRRERPLFLSPRLPADFRSFKTSKFQ